MPMHVKIIQAHEFIKATAEGTLDYEETKKLLIEIAATSLAAPLDDYEIMLDIREAHSAMSTTDLYNLVNELGKYRKVFSRKMAVIAPLRGFNNTDFFVLCAQRKGFPVNAFTSFVDAWEWLMAEPGVKKNEGDGFTHLVA